MRMHSFRLARIRSANKFWLTSNSRIASILLLASVLHLALLIVQATCGSSFMACSAAPAIRIAESGAAPRTTRHQPLLAQAIDKPKSKEKPRPVSIGVVTIPVFFVTDRDEVVGNWKDMAYGMVEVDMPAYIWMLNPETRQLQTALQKLGWKLDKTRRVTDPFSTLQLDGYISPQKIYSESKRPNMDATWFMRELGKYWDANDDHEVCVYVHGYASTLDNAIYSTAFLASSLYRPVICYSWDAEGTVSGFPKKYSDDQRTVRNIESKKRLARFLRQLSEASNGRDYSIYAHSLGNRFVLTTLKQFFIDPQPNNEAPPPLDIQDLVLVAPDIKLDDFQDCSADIASRAKHVLLLFNPKDKALAGARFHDAFHLKWPKKRAGADDADESGVRYINFSSIAEPQKFQGGKRWWPQFPIGHYIDFNHLGNIMRHGTPSPSYYVGCTEKIIKIEPPSKRTASSVSSRAITDMNKARARIRQLEEENARLRAGTGGGGPAPSSNGADAGITGGTASRGGGTAGTESSRD